METILKELKYIEGETSTGFVTLIIPAGSKAQQYISRLENEQFTASNIKCRV